jgi:NAD(P) transhydrogenase subunit alpha
MIVSVPRETFPGENRVAMLPDHVARLAHAGATMLVETGTGRSLGLSDEAYANAGASVLADRKKLLGGADLLLSIRGPSLEEIPGLKPEAVCINLMDPFRQ